MNITIKVPDGYVPTAVVNDVGYQAPLDRMTNDALLHVFEYGMQRIVNDKTGGKDKTDADKAEAANAMIARLTAEQYVRRKIGLGAVDPIVRFTRDILRGLLKKPQLAKRAAEYKAFSEAADREAYLDDWFATSPKEFADAVTAAAQDALAEAQAAAKRKAKLIDTLLPDMPEIPESATLIKAGDVETPAKKATGKKKG